MNQLVANRQRLTMKEGGSLSGIRDKVGVLSCMVGVALWALSFTAAANVLVDEWDAPSIFLNANNTTSFDVRVEQGPIASGVLGGYRRFRVENLGQDGNVFFNVPVPSGRNVTETGETSTAQGGRVTVIWDGAPGPRDGSNVLIPITLDGDNNVSDGLNFDLGNVDFLNACVSEAEARISVLVRVDQAVSVPFTFSLYTTANQWSTMTVNVPPAANRELFVADFPFASFAPQGNSGTSGADFANINAVRLSAESNNGDEDIDFFQIQTCGFDFGDAPETAQLAGRYYTTTLAVKADLSGSGDGFIRNNFQPGPRHRINGPFLGTGTNDTDSEDDGQPNASAAGDDLAGVDDEQAVSSFPSMGDQPGICDGLENTGDTSLYCVAIQVSNPTELAAQVVGWIDFSGGGVFSTDACGTSTDGSVIEDRLAGSFGTGWGCDRSAAGVRLGATGLSQIDSSPGAPTCPTGSAAGTPLQTAVEIGGGTWTTGNVPPNCEGTVVLLWDLSEATQVTLGETFARFRITTDNQLGTFFADSGPQPFGEVGDGEVEDHRIAPTNIPVAIHAFESRFLRNGLEVSWSTASETHNQGFHIWGETRDGISLLMKDMIQSRASDIADPQTYTVVIPGLTKADVGDLVITAVDYEGNEELYGYFRVGEKFGQPSDPAPINWQSIRSKAEQRLSQAGYSMQGDLWRQNSDFRRSSPVAADFAVAQAGMQRITFEQLEAAGLNLKGVSRSDIAVTLMGRAVPRIVEPAASNNRLFSAQSNAIGGRPEPGAAPFGPGDAILFWGEEPDFPDAKYIARYNYRIQVDADLAVNAGSINPRSRMVSPAVIHRVGARLAEATGYHASNPNPDPWFMKWLTTNAASNSFTATFNVPTGFDTRQSGRVSALVGGLTALPASPNHRIQLEVNGTVVEDYTFSDQTSHLISADVPSSLLQPGMNSVVVRSPGGLGVNSIALLDSVKLEWAEPMRASNNRITVTDPLGERVDGLRVSGFTTSEAIRAFAWTGSELYSVKTSVEGRGIVGVSLDSRADGAEVWTSPLSQLHSPQLVTAVPQQDLVSGLGNFLVIAHPAFMPASARESHPLNTYIQHRRAQGWDVSLVDLADIQVHFGNSMPLPDALTDFLTAASGAGTVSHVLLVGSDSYDYHDYGGQGSISFVPTRYKATSFINHTPSDGLLADLDGDGVSDIPLGRWPVRTLGDLQATVQKVFDWEFNLASLESAVWMTDQADPRMAPFESAVNRLSGLLVDGGWPAHQIDEIIFENVSSANMSTPAAARAQFFDALEQGRTLAGFSGHGAPTVWSFQSILTPGHVADMNNDGYPPLVSTQACYTTYFVSPNSDTLAHRLMNGYRLDAQGNALPGSANGAVAVHGAGTLSNLAQNDVFVRAVIEAQLQGRTLGEAVQVAREHAADRRMWDLVTNWTLLGDPTLRLQ